MNKKKIIIVVLVAFIVGITALGIWQKENIEAVYMFITNERADVERILDDNKKNLEDEIKKYSEDIPRMLTPEEEAKIASGEMTVEEATEMLINDTASEDATEYENNNENEEPENESANTTKEPSAKDESGVPSVEKMEETKKVTTSGEIIKRYTAQFYSLKAYYIGQLDQIEANARAEYSAMSKEQKKNLSKATFIGKYVGYATTLQGECDSKVNALLDGMKAELKAIGADTSIVGTIKKAYSDEKAARKAYYMNMLG